MFYLSCQSDHLWSCSPHIRSADRCQGASQLSQRTFLSLRSPCRLFFSSFMITRLKPETRLSLTMWSETRHPSVELGLNLLSTPSQYIDLAVSVKTGLFYLPYLSENWNLVIFVQHQLHCVNNLICQQYHTNWVLIV